MQRIIKYTALFLTVFSVYSQGNNKRKPEINLPNYDSRRIHFGFILAGNYTTYRAKNSEYFYQINDTLKRIETTGNGGFTLGFIFNAHLHEHIDFRFTPQVAFYQRGVDYTFFNLSTKKYTTENYSVEATFVEFPLLIKYKSQRRNNFGMYVIGGIKPSLSTSNKNKDQRPDKLRFNNKDFALEYGVGCDIYFPLFKLSPEIRFSNGFNNMRAADNNLFAKSLQKLNTNTITFLLNFE